MRRLHETPQSDDTHPIRNLLSLVGVPHTTVASERGPLFEDGDTTVRGTKAIVVYVSRKFGRGRWLPVDAAGEARVQEWLDMNLARLGRDALHRYETQLTGQPFLVGARPTIADIICYTNLKLAEQHGVELGGYRALRDWLCRIERLPGFLPLLTPPTDERTYTAVTFTPMVRQTQAHYGARGAAARMAGRAGNDTHFSSREVDFITRQDHFYLASVGQFGWPYVQYRGGPIGFLKVLNDRTLAYADFRGNRQYISTGNLNDDDRAALILLDYARRMRLKIMARATVHDAATKPQLMEQLNDNNYKAQVERAVVLDLVAFDWNCPQHITPRFTQLELVTQLADPSLNHA